MKKFLSFATLTVTIFLLVACGSSSKSENSTSSNKVELSSKPKIDGFHYYGDIPKNPKRIASLSSTYTGYLLQLGFDPVTVTSYDAKNPVLKEKVKNAKVLMPEDLESIAKQKPDLIVVDASDKNIDELKKIAPTIAIDYGKNDYLEILNRFGQIFGKEKEADQWIADWKSKTADIGKQLKEKLGQNVTFTVVGLYEKEIYLFGNNWGRGGEVIYKSLGFDAPQKVKDEVFPSGYLQVSQETVSEYIGDYVLVAAEDDKTGSALYESDVWKSIPAVQQNHILKVDANAFYFNDPLTLEYELKTIQDGLEKMN
ncbi:iron-hydroxamate ABC transporter substrate-binding protein [Streptococcus sanguinis]|uniref:Iron(3+)-hydroxamate-binding protein FhuD n=1 Tax=Streptococcus sanguinis TaxID=1305 RepID=A0ABD7JJS0_STRSA|nr:iron-hydroxamate ABC transporter substrate-binding protein [Streptococcus sanguinis]MCY7025815.1 iron-hydroxamate ABC transporter substrate-binding protein [Streptococcus sanguinis]PLA65482.1 ferrichrome ABC transporter substrate-binding protein [Streptococcus salivarius]RSI22081.1 Iron(3+)-hydroxamate-binding protein FhuD precursor [Streptococcus sanguinis]RSI37922.1 Iron(3+)-hydroxamate-binding protein FhuD precursor [Streptococcus sanguinis]